MTRVRPHRATVLKDIAEVCAKCANDVSCTPEYRGACPKLTILHKRLHRSTRHPGMPGRPRTHQYYVGYPATGLLALLVWVLQGEKRKSKRTHSTKLSGRKFLKMARWFLEQEAQEICKRD